MAAAAHSPAFAAKVGIPTKVATEFNQADKGTAMLKQAMQSRALRRRSEAAEELTEGRMHNATEERRERGRGA